MRWAACAALAFASLAGLEREARACAGCSNPNLPTARAANTTLAAGEVLAALNLTMTTMHVTEEDPFSGPAPSIPSSRWTPGSRSGPRGSVQTSFGRPPARAVDLGPRRNRLAER